MILKKLTIVFLAFMVTGCVSTYDIKKSITSISETIEGEPDLHVAIKSNDYSKVEQLISDGADVNSVYECQTPLTLASNSTYEVFNLLLSSGAKVYSYKISCLHKTNAFVELFMKSFYGDDSKITLMEELLSRRNVNLNDEYHFPHSKFNTAQLPLIAIIGNWWNTDASLEFIELLLKHGANPNKPNNNEEFYYSEKYGIKFSRSYPAILAVSNKPEALDLLVKYGLENLGSYSYYAKRSLDNFDSAYGWLTPDWQAKIRKRLTYMISYFSAAERGITMDQQSKLEDKFAALKDQIKRKVNSNSDLNLLLSEITKSQAYCTAFRKVASELNDTECAAMTDGRYREYVESESCMRAKQMMERFADEDKVLACPDGLWDARQQFINLWGKDKKKAADSVFKDYLKNNEVSEWTIKSDFPYFKTDLAGMLNAVKRATEKGHEAHHRNLWDNFAKDLQKPTTAETDAIMRTHRQNMRNIDRLARKLQSYKDRTLTLDQMSSNIDNSSSTSSTLNSGSKSCRKTASVDTTFELFSDAGEMNAARTCLSRAADARNRVCGASKSIDFPTTAKPGENVHVALISEGGQRLADGRYSKSKWSCRANITFQCACD